MNERICGYCGGDGVVEFDAGYTTHPEDIEPVVYIGTCPICEGRGETRDESFDALCNLTGRELEAYAGDAIFADADTLEV